MNTFASQCLTQSEILQLKYSNVFMSIFCVCAGTIIDCGAVVNAFAAENSRIMVLQNIRSMDKNKYA